MASSSTQAASSASTIPNPAATSVPGSTSQDNNATGGPNQGSATIEVDETSPAFGEEDSTYGEGPESYTTSLASSVVHYKIENGRRYHAYRDGAYVLPNDEVEQDRLDLLHHVHRLVLGGKLHLAPISKGVGRVLDVGTGTGIWAIDFADEYPSGEVIGTDLSPIQPAWVPPNLKFEIDDAESDWAYTAKFDFIHLRNMSGSIRDVSRLLRQAYNHLNPGGWIEWQDFETYPKTDDDSIPEDSALLGWYDTLNEASVKFGKPLNVAPTLKSAMEEVGFGRVEDEIFKVPLGSWPKDPRLKELGRWVFLATDESIQPYTLRLFTTVLGWKKEEAEVVVAKVRNELRNKKIHIYGVYHYVYGQKPPEEQDI